MKPRLLYGLIIPAAVWVSGCSEADYLRPGDEFPLLSLQTLDGKSVKVSEMLTSELVIFNIWATWCQPCREEMPALQSLQNHFPPANVRVVGISVDHDLNLVREFNLQYGLSFADYVMPVQEVEQLLTVEAYPSTFIVGGDGMVLDRVSGIQQWDDPEMISSLESLLVNQVMPHPEGVHPDTVPHESVHLEEAPDEDDSRQTGGGVNGHSDSDGDDAHE